MQSDTLNFIVWSNIQITNEMFLLIRHGLKNRFKPLEGQGQTQVRKRAINTDNKIYSTLDCRYYVFHFIRKEWRNKRYNIISRQPMIDKENVYAQGKKGWCRERFTVFASFKRQLFLWSFHLLTTYLTVHSFTISF